MGNCLSRDGGPKKATGHDSHNGAVVGQLNNQQMNSQQTPNHHQQQMHHGGGGGGRVPNMPNLHGGTPNSKDPQQQQQSHDTSGTGHSNNGTPNRGVGNAVSGAGSGERYSKNSSPADGLKDTRPLGGSGASGSGGGQQKVVVALYSYEARADGDLSFRKVSRQ